MKNIFCFPFLCFGMLWAIVVYAQPAKVYRDSVPVAAENLHSHYQRIQDSTASVVRQLESQRLIAQQKMQLLESIVEARRQGGQLRIYLSAAIILLVLMIVVVVLYAKLRERNRKLSKQSIEIVNGNRELQKNLVQRQLLVSEIQHRVKNNLQVISSFLEMQAENSSDKTTRAQFLEGKNRVVSIAIVHDLIYNHENVTGLNMKEYVTRLTSAIKRDLWRDVPSLINVECATIKLPINTAIPLGILINELLTNSFKHARVDRQELEISLNITAVGDEIKLYYADNGTGAPENYEEGKKGLGMKIVRSMIRQLHARSETSMMGCFEFTMIFKFS